MIKRRNKYHARPTVVDGIKFASKAEARRYQGLQVLERDGKIRLLRCHPRFALIPGFTYQEKRIRPAYYEADFSYHENGQFVVEDVKGAIETPVFKLKWKLMKSLYPDWDFRIYRQGE